MPSGTPDYRSVCPRQRPALELQGFITQGLYQNKQISLTNITIIHPSLIIDRLAMKPCYEQQGFMIIFY